MQESHHDLKSELDENKRALKVKQLESDKAKRKINELTNINENLTKRLDSMEQRMKRNQQEMVDKHDTAMNSLRQELSVQEDRIRHLVAENAQLQKELQQDWDLP